MLEFSEALSLKSMRVINSAPHAGVIMMSHFQFCNHQLNPCPEPDVFLVRAVNVLPVSGLPWPIVRYVALSHAVHYLEPHRWWITQCNYPCDEDETDNCAI